MKRYNCLDGEMNGLIEFDAALAMTPVKDNPIDRDNFYPADGNDLDGEEGGPFDYASGLFNKKERAKRRAKREKRKDLRQERRTARTLSKADARKSQAEALKLASKESKADVEMAKALRAPVETKKGLSMTAKVGIGLGVVAVLGIGAYFLLKKKK
jgi:hypothetical protein